VLTTFDIHSFLGSLPLKMPSSEVTVAKLPQTGAESTTVPTTITMGIQSSEGAGDSSMNVNLASSNGSLVTVSGPETEISYEYRSPTPAPGPTIDRPEIQSEQESSKQVEQVVESVVSRIEAQPENLAISTENIEKVAEIVSIENPQKIGTEISSKLTSQDASFESVAVSEAEIRIDVQSTVPTPSPTVDLPVSPETSLDESVEETIAKRKYDRNSLDSFNRYKIIQILCTF